MEDNEGPQPAGSTYEKGDAKVVFFGWLDNDGNGTSGFRAVLEFPQGLPSCRCQSVGTVRL